MSNFLADVLATDHPLFTKTIADFERVSGHSGVDTRLIADMTEAAHDVMRRLRIDTADTSGKELYHALNAAVGTGNLEDILSDPALHYTLLRFDDGPVSFCIYDVIENAHHELPYDERKVGHGQMHLRAEIIRRYADHDKTDNKMIHELAEQAGMKPPEDEGHPALMLTSGQSSLQEKSDDSLPTLLAVGDIFTDAFIKLSEDVVRVEKDETGDSWLKIPFGGRPPYEEVEVVQSVGPAPNSAVSFARLGLNSGLMAWLGDDQPGNESLAHLSREGVNTDLVRQKKGTKSNYYYVLRVGAERTILTKNEQYDYTWIAPQKPPKWIYLASASEDSWQLHMDLLDYMNEHSDIRFVFQPGTFHFKWGKEKLARLYERAELVILNREEAADITGQPADKISVLAGALHELGPKTVVITDGPNGSFASFDGKLVTMPNYPDPAPPYDRTGAGDAFASTIVAALALGESMETALTWAPINSMSVVQKLGAQTGLLSKADVLKYLGEAPADYKVSEYSD